MHQSAELKDRTTCAGLNEPAINVAVYAVGAAMCEVLEDLCDELKALRVELTGDDSWLAHIESNTTPGNQP